MPDVRLPDGTIVKNVPEGTTRSELMRRLGRSRSARLASLAESKPAEFDPSSPEFRSRFGPASGGVRGFFEGVGASLADIGLGAQQLFSPGNEELQQEASEKRRIDAPMSERGSNIAGRVAGAIVPALPTLAIPGANTVTGAAAIGAGLGALQPAESGGERFANIGLGGALCGVGQKVGQGIANAASSRLASRAAASEARNVARQPLNELIGQSRGLGLTVPPATANSSMLNRTLEGFAGKLTTGQGASVLNQRVANDVAKKAIGIADDVPLSKASVKSIRQDAGKIYGDIVKTGDVIADAQFIDDLARVPEELTSIQADFPDLKIQGAKDVSDLVQGLARDKFSAKSAVEVIKRLRDDATTNFKSFDDPAKRALAFAQRKAADSLDDLLLRHLDNTGNTALASQYRPARQLIAKTHTVESALNEAGNINPRDLARQLNRGKPLSGDLETLARFADAFPKAARETTESFPGVSPLDFGFSGLVGGGAVAASSPAAGVLAALPLLRAGVRRGILSGPAQNALLTPATKPGAIGNTGLTLLDIIGRNAGPGVAAIGTN